MKRIGAFFLAALLALGTATTCFAEETASVGGSQFYATSMSQSDNYAELSLSGNTLTVLRRSDLKHTGSDSIRILDGDRTFLQQEAKWTEYFWEDGNGYDLTIDLSTLGSQTATVKITSWNDRAYTLLTAEIAKGDAGWVFVDDASLAKQYNYDALRRLQNGQVPNDFATLKSQYSQTADAAVLGEIEAKALEVTADCQDDREKILAINRWIVDNIAYDSDMSGNDYYEWIENHPEDTVRLDNPLHAFTEGYALCYGYAKLTTLMMGYAGIDCVYLAGRIPTEADQQIDDVIDEESMKTVNHAWNAVKLDDRWYMIDTCLDARGYYSRTDPEDPSTGSVTTSGGASYLNTFASLTTFSKDHIALRLGAKNFGTKLTASAVPDGWV